MADLLAGNEDGDFIRVRGARVHNLRGIDVDLPRDRFVVLTGVSGSGKSSLAYDTLYAEGQRRYVESLSSYARQFLDRLERPDVDLVEGLPPTVSIDQHSASTNPRSTVATVTEIHDYLRLLYARLGIPHCPNCDQAIRRQSPEQMVETVLAMQEGRKVLILAPLVRGRKGAHAEAFQAVRRAGLIRVRVDGVVQELEKTDPKLEKARVHSIEAVVDRLVVRDGIRPRLAESLDLAIKLGEGSVILSAQDGTDWKDEPLSLHFACPSCGTSLEALEPRSFSFNSPYGACKTCDGIGSITAFDEHLVIPDCSLSLETGALAPWRDSKGSRPNSKNEPEWVREFLKQRKLSRTKPLQDWPPPALVAFIHGSAGPRPVIGLLPGLQSDYESSRSEDQKARLGVYRSESVCPDCMGSRLRAEARAVKVEGTTLPEVSALPISLARQHFSGMQFSEAEAAVGAPLAREIALRLSFLDRVGLGYLTLSRAADSLSGGELQRVRLAGQIGSGLVGICYVLDEPTAGLHPADTDRLLEILRDLNGQGNTLLVVEHDEATIRAADWLVDLGPGAGPDGGLVIAEGPPGRAIASVPSSTLGFLSHEWRIAVRQRGRLAASRGHLRVVGARARNLKSIDTTFPLGAMTCVSGVSGSGKSTLVHEILARAVRRHLEQSGPPPGAHERVEGLESIDRLVVIDQSPIGRGPRSTPATYSGLFDEIRKIFARTREAKLRGYGANRFSFNVKGGRCEACLGQGVRRVVMNFLPDLYVRCDTCDGKRFNRQTLEVHFKAKSIGDVLEMRVDESLRFFDAQPKVLRGLASLHEAGLGYLTLGQPSTTLSGGEAQRIKLAAEVARPAMGRTLYILDEPTTGLHFADVDRLLKTLQRLVDPGNTVVVVEHHLDVIKSADWVVDLGPGGGELGGNLVAMGTPRDVSTNPESLTGRYLKPLLDEMMESENAS